MANDNPHQSVPTVSYIGKNCLVELVFDAEKRETALVVAQADGSQSIVPEFETAEGRLLIPYSARNNLIAHRCVLLPSSPQSFESKEALLNGVVGFLHRYVDLSPAFEQLAAHYILFSWVYDSFNEVPYLRLRGDYGTGKTRGLLVIGALCYKAFFAAGASTVSPIFHTLDRFGGTLILDEADFRFSDATADLIKILNNGTVRGLPVLRTVQNRYKEFNPAAFDVFGPKLVAMRGSFQDDALESRFITEESGQRPLRSDIPLHLPAAFEGEALALRNRLLDFRLRSLRTTKLRPDRALASLDPRMNQIVVPLLSIVDDEAALALLQSFLQNKATERVRAWGDSLPGHVLRAALRVLAAGKDAPIQSVADECIRQGRADVSGPLSARRVGAILKTTFRVQTRKMHGVYRIPVAERERLATFATRYGIDLDELRSD
jgi:hypothetical protein